MKFDEAIKKMLEGEKITRKLWLGQIYFKYDEIDGKTSINAYQPTLTNFLYNESIMTSDGWIVEGVENHEWFFYDIVQFLRDGKKARLKHWNNESFIQFDPPSKCLIYRCMEVIPYAPDFASFVSEDWMIVA